MQRNDEPEVHNMSDMENHEHRTVPADNGVSPLWKALSIIVALGAVAYSASPIDAVPDAIPVLGWLDDLGVTAIAAMNVYQQFAKNQGALTVKIVKYVKWMLVAIIAVAAIAFGGLIVAIIALIKGA